MKRGRSISAFKGKEQFKNEMVRIIPLITTSTLLDRIYLRIAASLEVRFFKWRKIPKFKRNPKE